MKSTGIVRRIDELGRIVIPKELRRKLNINEKAELRDGDTVEIYTDEDSIILKKYQPGCIFCGEIKELRNFKGKCICTGCLKDIKGNKNYR